MATHALVAALPVKELDAEQIALVKRTVAVGATDDELALFFFDCQRRGVHPLDKLIHFTKRQGKYTPITSIDFFRTRAHDTGKCAGISDATFDGEARKPGFSAQVTVKRVVEGIVAEFTATARWDEYKPQSNDFMWTRMPHTMLGKCAEALALRKAFPQELAGLYTGDEMAQAGVVPPPSQAPSVEAVNVATGEIIESEVLPEKSKEPGPIPQTYTGVVTVLEVDQTGKKPIYRFKLDEQAMSTLDGGLSIEVGKFEGKRATVTYRPNANGVLILKSVRTPDVVSELTADEVPF